MTATSNARRSGLREGAVLGCVTSVREVLRGCRVVPLGVMRYVAVASPGFVGEHLGEGLTRGNFARLPFLVFNRKDAMHEQWVKQAFKVREPRLQARFVPSSEAYVQAASRGWGIGVVPLLQVQSLLDGGALQVIYPEISLPIPLYWHQWKLGPESAEPFSRKGQLDQIGAALAAGAQGTLEQPCAPGDLKTKKRGV